MTSKELQQLASICIIEEQFDLTMDDLCRACSVQTEIIVELVDEGVLDAEGQSPRDWRFDGRNIRRARVALRLQHDLGVNLAGAALALQLMEEVEALRARLQLFGEK